MSPHPIATFPSIEEFYAAANARRRSPVIDYGVLWMAKDRRWPRWRISYVDLTGELYAIALGGVADSGTVEVLARFPLRPCPTCTGKGGHMSACHACSGTGYSRQLVDAALAGWAEVCGTDGSLDWARRRAVGERIAVPTTPEPDPFERLLEPGAGSAGKLQR